MLNAGADNFDPATNRLGSLNGRATDFRPVEVQAVALALPIKLKPYQPDTVKTIVSQALFFDRKVCPRSKISA